MKFIRFSLAAALILAGCATRQRDHFYTLDAQPPGPAASRSQFDRQVTVQVTVPSIVDRGEMVLMTSGSVVVLEHERWAAPLADLVTSTLSQDIERRRTDVVVLPRSADHAGIPLVRLRVEVDRIAARLGEPTRLEAHWRVTDVRSGHETVGRDTFTSTGQPQNYSEIASALSACVALLAERLAAEISTG
jgi:uncharacterized protein